MLQNIIFEGRLVKDPEIISGEFGDYCFMSVVSDRPYKDKAGKWQDNATFIPCKFTGDFVIQKLQQCKKGYKLLLDGVFDSYQGKDDKFKQLNIKINKIHSFIVPQGAVEEEAKAAATEKVLLDDEVPF